MTDFVHGGPPRYAHQMRGLRKLITTGGKGALLFDPGTGKTAVIIDYACLLALKSHTGEARVLVIAPLAATDTWVLQMEKFASPQVSWWAEVVGGSMLEKAEALAARGGNLYRRGLIKAEDRRREAPGHPRALHHSFAEAWAVGNRSDHLSLRPPMTSSEGPDGLGDGRPRLIVEIINLDPLQRRDEMGSRNMADVFLDAIKRFAPDLVVIDEAHKIKSAGANASRLLHRVQKWVPRRALLTGTVMPHSPLDVFAQWRFLDPYAFGTKDGNGVLKQAVLSEFHARYARMGGFYGKEVKGYDNLDLMQQIMAKNAVVARKEDCLDLPPTQIVLLPVRLNAAETKAYIDIKARMAADLPSGNQASVTSVLVQGMRLRQITSGHVPADDDMPMEVLGASKVEVISDLIKTTLEHEKRIVVFALFTFEIQMLAEVLGRANPGTEIQVIQGGTSAAVRQEFRARFGSDNPTRMIMIAQIKTMSVAVNELVTASHAIFGSLSQQRDDLVQAMARLDRIGQTRPVTFWVAIAPGTVDELIWDSHTERTNLEDAMLRHIQQGGFIGGGQRQPLLANLGMGARG